MTVSLSCTCQFTRLELYWWKSHNLNRKGLVISWTRQFVRERTKDKMAMASIRSNLLRAALRGASRNSVQPKRGFASSAHDDARKSLSLSLRYFFFNCDGMCTATGSRLSLFACLYWRIFFLVTFSNFS